MFRWRSVPLLTKGSACPSFRVSESSPREAAVNDKSYISSPPHFPSPHLLSSPHSHVGVSRSVGCYKGRAWQQNCVYCRLCFVVRLGGGGCTCIELFALRCMWWHSRLLRKHGLVWFKKEASGSWMVTLLYTVAVLFSFSCNLISFSSLSYRSYWGALQMFDLNRKSAVI